ncbi:pentatricopeptide repeat-containing protein At3g24000, mitochondrial-like [Selaginella moellendorffii]|uniref:pentatricopeptide repeat-containing protein At3g24000, mitochondrial-like n=1 Tax=Selaginella moellendorffii TaxID=88036 RepID=UPI000D1CC2BA|nr:pentatricopeptide repeat-containing protein At3g24000, mitochondrial-like [Selaginella moellendorffii]XP_024528532.1 pentatricopeptide repeat-containing protein At3g24000, mitochondrial-like [Selaginella moellendorffii]|eukprot:XP_024528531.1 pentatricopeptide repeat-containing protein At3g24000, mitochondrial-like [Selaginella moellendorffii]
MTMQPRIQHRNTNSSSRENSIAAYEELKQRGVRPSIGVVLEALKQCKNSRDIETGRRIHRDALVTGDYSNIFVRNVLSDMYCKCGSLPDARQVFESMEYRDVVSWNSIILGYAQAGDSSTALKLFSRMQNEATCKPNSVTLLAALKACSKLAERAQHECLDKVRSIHSVALHRIERKKEESELELFLASNLVHMYARCGSMVEARGVFDSMKRHDVVSWTAIILGYAHAGNAKLALEFFELMQARGFLPDRVTVLAALKACAVLAEKEEARLLGGRFIKLECLERGRALHSQITRAHGMDWKDTVLATALVDMYAKCGSLVEAREVFDGMKQHDVVSWTAMISGYAQGGDGELALEFFSRMKEHGCVPDAVTFVAALQACGSLAALESGREIEAQVRGAGLGTNLVVANALVDFYGKCGCMEDAREVFELIPRKDLVSWSSLVTGYSSQGDTRSVFELLERMEREERHLQPDEIMLLSILTACNHAGLVEQGKRYFSSLRSPTVQHYTCMIDLLGRANHLDSAVALLRSMPFPPNEVTWTTLLSSARKWKNVGVGRMAFEALVKLDDTNSSAYILMSSIYASVGNWDEAARVRALRIKAGAWKREPGLSSWTDSSTGRVHKFSAGDAKHHPQGEEIHFKLDHLLSRMKLQAGYVPRLSSVLANVPDEEKEWALCGHSEKLAIACALVNSAPGTAIRIVKNLRVCDDCHEATALISRLEGRTIVCRDAVRFHRFVDGSCSCGGFW